MKIKDLFESKNRPCIVVDVQPIYMENAYIDVTRLMQFLNNKNKILAFYNGEEYTDESLNDVKEYWSENGFTNFDNVIFEDKGYGYLRSWMDAVEPDIIITVIREMYNQKVSDSRMLFDGEGGDEYQNYMNSLGIPDSLDGDGLGVDWTSLSQLKEYSGCYIMGGDKDECLREVQLLMNAFNIKYKEISDFIY